MAATVKPMRTAGAVPADYRGPVYWRVMEYGFVEGPSAEHIEFTDSQERLDRLFIDRYKMPGKDIFTSGTVFDENGQLLPEWKEPIKARWLHARPARVEFAPNTHSARVSERVYDALLSLEPGKHHAFPIDIARKDGSIERRYEVFFAQNAFFEGRELHRRANNLEPPSNALAMAGYRYQSPSWLMAKFTDHFGYLDQSVIQGWHWFKGSDTNHYFSPELFAKLQPMGDIFEKWEVAIPVGVADDAYTSSDDDGTANIPEPAEDSVSGISARLARAFRQWTGLRR